MRIRASRKPVIKIIEYASFVKKNYQEKIIFLKTEEKNVILSV
jgi:hypothetical protein